MSEFLLETKGLKKYFKVPGGMLHAVDDVNITIRSGETLGVVGESGCGKSTLGQTLMMIYQPTEGQIIFDGEDMTAWSKRQRAENRQKIQMIFQDPYSSLNPRMCVQDLIAEPMLVSKSFGSKQEVYSRVRHLMDIVGLASRVASAYPHELDGGRRQRIGVARALALNPKLIICDEPVSALDVSIQAQILNLLMDLQRDMGLTYMFITHDLSVVKHISNEIAVMYLGQCVERASSRTLFREPLHPYTQALLKAIPVPRLDCKRQKSDIIRGEVTSPINPAQGCRFAARCPHCTEKCRESNIPLREVSEGHFVACVHA